MEQKLWIWIISVLFCAITSQCASRHTLTTATKCVFYNETLCKSSHGESGCGNATQDCSSTNDSDKPMYCYAVWTNNTETNKLILKVI